LGGQICFRVSNFGGPSPDIRIPEWEIKHFGEVKKISEKCPKTLSIAADIRAAVAADGKPQ
jgi:hypothetical protein